MFDACPAESFLLGSIAYDVKQFAKEIGVGLAHFLEQVLMEIDDNIVRPSSMHLFRDMSTGSSKAADDVVAPQFADSFLHSASPKRICELDFDQEGRDHGKYIDRHSYTEQHHPHVEDSQSGIMRGVDNFSIANSGEGDDGHVECLQKGDGGSAEQAIADHGQRDQADEKNCAQDGSGGED